jgi:hypothetical protein
MKYRKVYLFTQIHTVVILTKSWMIAQRSMRTRLMRPFSFSAIVSEISHFFIFTEAATLSGDEAARATKYFRIPMHVHTPLTGEPRIGQELYFSYSIQVLITGLL